MIVYDPSAKLGTSDIELLMQPFCYDSATDYEPDWNALEVVQQAMAELSPLDQKILYGVFYLRLTYEELADYIGTKAKSHAWRKTQQALLRLKAKIENKPQLNRQVKGPHMTQYKTWDDGAWAALNELSTFASELSRDDTVFTPISQALAAEVREDFDDHRALRLIERAGVGAIHILCDTEPFDIDEMHKLLCNKQHDYGHGNILSFGMVGVAVRLCDKIARMNNLLKRGADSRNESLTDTYMDIVGYAAIALMLYDGSFELELNSDK